MDISDTAVSIAFRQDLRRALYHLYNPVQLSQNPLIEFLPAAQSGDPSSSLRRILLDAIEALKPDATVPAQSNAWRVYKLLSQRFAEQFSQREVATDLALSIRQLRRDESLALWMHYNLASRSLEASALTRPAVNEASPDNGTPSMEQELEWLRRTEPSETVDISRAMSTVLEIIAPLAQESAVNVICSGQRTLRPLWCGQPPCARRC